MPDDVLRQQQVLSAAATMSGASPTDLPGDSGVTPNKLEAMKEIGDLGLKRYSGTITEEFLTMLKGAAGQRLLAELRDNHPVVGAIMFALKMLIRQVEWEVESADETPECVEDAEFVRGCLDDMSHSWIDFLNEALSMLTYGYSYHEVVYKMRVGPEEDDPTKRSRYTDRKIGWRKMPIRAQETLYRWELDDEGGVKGFWQQPPIGPLRYIPLNRSLLFRFDTFKGNPEGRSILRNAVVPYYIQKRLQEIESIGIERDLAGLPVITAPAVYMSREATPEQQAVLTVLRDIVRNIRRNDQEGVIMPGDLHPTSGKPLFELKLLNSGGSRQVNTNDIINRYDQRIAMTVLADFVLLGHQKIGTQALAKTKTDIFALAVGALLDVICDIFNRYAIPSLLRLNGRKIDKTPTLKHGDVQALDFTEFASLVGGLTGAGMALFPDPNLENWVRRRFGLPEPSLDTDVVGDGGGETETGQRPGKEGEEIAEPGSGPPRREGPPMRGEQPGKKAPPGKETEDEEDEDA